MKGACVIGVGQSAYTKRGEQAGIGPLRLMVDAVRAAADDAGLDVRSIDGLGTFPDEEITIGSAARSLALRRLTYSGSVWGSGGSDCCAAVGLAANAVMVGQARYVAVVRSICVRPDKRYGHNPNVQHNSFNAPYGLHAPAAMTALMVRRHMEVYGTTREQWGAWAVQCRSHANRNPAAVMRDRPLDLEQYLAARMIAEPLGLFDCCLETDGACAVIVTSADRARDARDPVHILAHAQANAEQWGAGHMGGFNMPDDAYLTQNTVALGEELMGRAGVGIDAVDVAQIYDAFTGMAMIALEDLGFCARGECGAYVAAGRTSWPHGDVPMNTAGGLLSEAYVHGLNLVVEGVRQIRGTSSSQVDGAEVSLVAASGGTGPTSGLLLSSLA